jgi:hypothetical protein
VRHFCAQKYGSNSCGVTIFLPLPGSFRCYN